MKNITRLLHHLFVPHEKNNYRAKLLHPDLLSLFLVGAIVVNFLLQQPLSGAGSVLGYATDITVEKLYQLTNEQRTSNQLPTLQYNEKLAIAAKQKADDMFSKNYWAHYSPEGTTPWSFILNSGYQYEYAGENLAKNFMFSQGVVDAWMNSPTHRENMLRKEYSEVGFAMANGVLNGEETTLVVQMFGKPLATATTQSDRFAPEPVEAAETQTAPEETFSPDTSPVVNFQPKILGTNLLPAYMNMNLIFLSILMFALLIDLYVAIKMKYVRIGGKNLVHFAFLGFMIVAILILRNGAVL